MYIFVILTILNYGIIEGSYGSLGMDSVVCTVRVKKVWICQIISYFTCFCMWFNVWNTERCLQLFDVLHMKQSGAHVNVTIFECEQTVLTFIPTRQVMHSNVKLKTFYLSARAWREGTREIRRDLTEMCVLITSRAKCWHLSCFSK